MNLLIDIGNTHTDMALATSKRVSRIVRFPTEDWYSKKYEGHIPGVTGKTQVQQALCSSVVPSVTQIAKTFLTGSGLRKWVAV